MISLTRDGLDELNALCRAIEPLNAEQKEKPEAVVLVAKPQYASEVCQLAENLDQFDFMRSRYFRQSAARLRPNMSLQSVALHHHRS